MPKRKVKEYKENPIIKGYKCTLVPLNQLLTNKLNNTKKYSISFACIGMSY
jgi:hypothetical protein